MKKNILFLSGLFATLFFVCSGFLNAALSAENLVANPSLEVDGGAGAPADWAQEIAGSNDAVFSYLDSGAQNGARSMKITMTWRTSGSADLAPAAPVSVTPGRLIILKITTGHRWKRKPMLSFRTQREI